MSINMEQNPGIDQTKYRLFGIGINNIMRFTSELISIDQRKKFHSKILLQRSLDSLYILSISIVQFFLHAGTQTGMLRKLSMH